jgi:hypothetical protein
MEKYNKKSVYEKLKTFDYLSKEDSFIEVTEWHNGEGWDITIDDKVISLTHGQLAAINYLTSTLDYYEEVQCN